jgi:signal transduction histidine kinase
MPRSPKGSKEVREGRGGNRKARPALAPAASSVPPAQAGGEPASQLPIVGIVASAGGLDAFVKLLDALPEKCAMAFVLVPHLDPKRESLMPAILGRHTRLPVVTASDGERVEADHVYVIPPDRVMTVREGVLRLGAADPRSSPNALDLFLRSLAEDQQENAIGIVLSGTGSSGTAGVKEINRTRDNRIEGVVVTFADVSDLKAADAELRRLNSELEQRVKQRTAEVESLATPLTRAEQAERRRLSHFLHDDLQQLLYSAELKLSALRTPEGPAAPIGELNDLVHRAIEATRKLAVDLSPPVLKDEGVVPMLIWLGSQIRESHGLEVEVKGPRTHYPMSDGVRVLLYQGARELLFNVVKHAGAKRATVEVSANDGMFRIDVTDDGRGFTPDSVDTERQGHFGLNSLRERLALFGGHVGIDSTLGGGTCVSLLMPQSRLADSE